MKKLISILLAVVLVLGLAACGGSSETPKSNGPEVPVKEFSEAIKAFDVAKIKEIVGEEGDLDELTEDMGGAEKALLDLMKSWCSKLKYKIGEIKEDGGKATVVTEYTYTDGSDVMKMAMSEYITKAMTAAFSGQEVTEEAMIKILTDALDSAQKSVQTKEGTASVTYTLEKKDDAWKITDSSDEIVNVVTCNMLGALEDMFGGLGGDDDPSGGDTESSFGNATVAESVIYDENNIKITVKGLNTKGTFGPEVDLLIENNSDKKITVRAEYAAVNGYMIESFAGSEVAAGKKANEALSLEEDSLKAAGISTLADIEFVLSIEDPDAWTEIGKTGKVALKTSEYDGYLYSFDESGNEVYNKNGVKIVVQGLKKSTFGSQSIQVYVSNESGKNIGVRAEDVSVNGFMIDGMLSAQVWNGKHAVDELSFWSNDLEKNGITELKEVEVKFHIYDIDSYDTIDDSDPIKLTF